jgi:hypothetical protein
MSLPHLLGRKKALFLFSLKICLHCLAVSFSLLALFKFHQSISAYLLSQFKGTVSLRLWGVTIFLGYVIRQFQTVKDPQPGFP